MGVPPKSSISNRILKYKPSSYWGTTMIGEPPGAWRVASATSLNDQGYRPEPVRSDSKRGRER